MKLIYFLLETLSMLQTLDKETQKFATIYRYDGNDTEYGSSSIVNGKDETHKIAFDPSAFAEITSVEIVLASGE